jgi:hypothetical protein
MVEDGQRKLSIVEAGQRKLEAAATRPLPDAKRRKRPEIV